MFHLPDLSSRRVEPELMDDPALGPREHRDALAGLARLNKVSLAARPLWAEMAQLAAIDPARTLRVLDVACGSGDVTVELARLAAAQDRRLEIHGCDISPLALALAGERARRAGSPTRFFRLDVLADAVPAGYDVVMSSLFLHHLADNDAIRLLAEMMRAARLMVLVSDLNRCAEGLAAAWLGTRMLTRSPIVRADGPRSVGAAFSITEVRRLADAAGMCGARIRRAWPWRWLLCWRRR